MTSRRHRLLLAAVLSLALGAGVWLAQATASPVDLSAAQDGAALAAASSAHGGVVSVRLRTPTPCMVAGASLWLRGVDPRPAGARVTALAQRGTSKLHALLRVFRV